MTDVGYAHLGEAEARNYGHYVAVQAIDGDAEQLCSLPLSEGRLPQNSHEIVLYSLFQGTSVFSDEPCQIGSQITMDLGARRPLVPDGSDTEGVPDYLDTELRLLRPAGRKWRLRRGVRGCGAAPDLHRGRVLPAEQHGHGHRNRLQGVHVLRQGHREPRWRRWESSPRRRSTSPPWASARQATSRRARPTCSTRPSRGCTARFCATRASATAAPSGARSTRWPPCSAVVIIAASASLIYNSFAISVAERTRQFGLLASIGASRKQLRRMVRFEALLLADRRRSVGPGAGHRAARSWCWKPCRPL